MADDAAVDRDGDALRVGAAGLLRRVREQRGEVGGLDLAGLPVHGQPHAEALTSWLAVNRAREKSRATAGIAPVVTSAAIASAVTGASR